jgi:hypothetical protein
MQTTDKILGSKGLLAQILTIIQEERNEEPQESTANILSGEAGGLKWEVSE